VSHFLRDPGQRVPTAVLLNGQSGHDQPTWTAAVKLAEEDVWPEALTCRTLAPTELRARGDGDMGNIGHRGEWGKNLQRYLRSRLVGMTRAVMEEWLLKFGAKVGRHARFAEWRREMVRGMMGDSLVALEKVERLFAVLVSQWVAICHEYHEIEPLRYREVGNHCPHGVPTYSVGSPKATAKVGEPVSPRAVTGHRSEPQVTSVRTERFDFNQDVAIGQCAPCPLRPLDNGSSIVWSGKIIEPDRFEVLFPVETI
jgi:hypothetical protein